MGARSLVTFGNHPRGLRLEPTAAAKDVVDRSPGVSLGRIGSAPGGTLSLTRIQSYPLRFGGAGVGASQSGPASRAEPQVRYE